MRMGRFAACLVSVAAFGDPACWLGIVNYHSCCHPALGAEGNQLCWNQLFNFQQCCAIDPCLYELQEHQTNCLDSAPDHALVQNALDILRRIGQSELSRYMSATQTFLLQKGEIGFDPMASTAFLAGQRLKGYPGYGQAGSRARIYYEVACNSAHLLSEKVLPLCHELSANLLNRKEIERKVQMLHITVFLSSELHRRAGYFFRVAVELLGWWDLSGHCTQQRYLAQLLADSLQSHWETMGQALRELATPQSYAPGMGSTSNVLVERMSSPALIDFWKKLVEGVMSTACLDIVLNLVVLVSYMLEEAVRLKTHLFAQLFVAELKASTSSAPDEVSQVAVTPLRSAKVLLSGDDQQFVFQTCRCCLRYHVLLQLIEAMDGNVSMLEIGVHTASTATFLLDKVPFLHWTGIDPYHNYGDVSGDELYRAATGKLEPFGERARLLRMSSSEAWMTGAVQGPDSYAMDVLFVDGDHDYNATMQDLSTWSKIVRPGGIISGHDLFNPVNDGVTQAVEDLLRGRNQVVNFATDHTYWWYS